MVRANKKVVKKLTTKEMLVRASLTILDSVFYGFLILATIFIFLPVVRDISNYLWGLSIGL